MDQQTEIEETSFAVRWENGRAIGVVEAVGEVDLATIVAFKAALIEAAGADDGMIIDLARVTYMDSSGFSTLLDVNRVLRPMGLPMFLVGANTNIKRMLEITRLNSIFSVGENVAEAMGRISELDAVAVA